MNIVQLAGAVAFGDAIGNHIALLDRRLKERGYQASVYAMGIHEKRSDITRHIDQMPRLAGDDVMLYHMSHSTPMNQLLKTEQCRKIMVYHNITPPDFFRNFDCVSAESMAAGLQEVRELRPYVDACVAMSEYNKRDLINMGYDPDKIWVMPSYLIPFEDYQKEPEPEILRQYSDGWTNILFVGRVAPNKKHENIIRAFAWYKKHINPNSRLILIGAEYTPLYSQALRSYVSHLGVPDVIFPGHISFSAIVAFYKCASVFLCMSEHEGFCVPLIEAMYFNVPVIAYASSAIPDTLGGAGILMDTREPAAVARMMETVRTDLVLRAALIERQRARLNEVMACQSGEAFFNFLNDFIDRRNILRRGTAS